MGCGRVRYTQRVIGAGDAASNNVHDGGNDEGLGAGRLDGSACSSGFRRLGCAFSAARERPVVSGAD